MKKKNQRLQDISDEQIKKAFDLRKRGLHVERIAGATGITKHSLAVWFSKPPEKLLTRVVRSDLLKELIIEHDNFKKANISADQDELNIQQRLSIPVIDRRGTSTGWASRHAIDEEARQARQLNSISPISVSTNTEYVQANIDRKLELTSHQIKSEQPVDHLVESIIPSATGISSTSKSGIFPLEINSQNMVELNTKLITYKKTIESHLEAVNSLLSNLDTLTYIESLEDAEKEYRNRIANLEQEVLRLKTVERTL